MTFAPIFHSTAWSTPLSKLQQAIVKGSYFGTIKYFSYGGPEITAPLASVANAVESAYVLTPREALPKITSSPTTSTKRHFIFEGDPFVPYSTDPNHTSERARQTAAKWLAIAGHLEAEENAAAAEAKKKAAAEASAERARIKRLDEIANLHFGQNFDRLGTNKASALEEIYRLEQELADEKDAA